MFAAAAPTLSRWICGYVRYRSHVGSPSSATCCTFPTTPTISTGLGGPSLSSTRRRAPIGSSPSSHWLASSSFTTATARVLSVSRSENVRPRFNGMRAASKYPAVTVRYCASGTRSRSTARPSTVNGTRAQQPAQGEQRDRARIRDRRQRRQVLGERALERDDRVAGCRIASAGSVRRADRTPRRIESRRDRLHVREALRQHRHDDEQHDGERDLGADEHAANPSTAARRCPAAACPGARRARPRSRTRARGSTPKSTPVSDDTASENIKTATSTRDLAGSGQLLSAPAPRGQPRPTGRPARRALLPRRRPATLRPEPGGRRRVRDDPSASCTARSLPPARRAGQHQVREVGAGDEQDGSDRRKQRPEGRPKRADDAIDHRDHAHAALSRVLDGKLLLQSPSDRVQLARRLRQRHPLPEPAHADG